MAYVVRAMGTHETQIRRSVFLLRPALPILEAEIMTAKPWETDEPTTDELRKRVAALTAPMRGER